MVDTETPLRSISRSVLRLPRTDTEPGWVNDCKSSGRTLQHVTPTIISKAYEILTLTDGHWERAGRAPADRTQPG